MNPPNIPGYTADELEGLTPDELEALSDDTGDEAQNELEALAGNDDDTGKPADTGTGTGTDTTDTTDEQPDAPTYKAEAPADAAAQLATQQAARTQAKADDRTALKQLHEGVIDFDEYEAIKDKADAAREAADDAINSLKAVISKAEISAEMTQQEALRAWNTEVSGAMKASKAEGFDYAANPALHKELNGLVRAFAMEATENGMSDEGLKASKWALSQAQATMRTRHPELYKAPAAGQQQRQAGQPRHNLTTLGGLPSADRGLAENDTMRRIGQLEGDAHERAIGNMSEKEIDRLLADSDR